MISPFASLDVVDLGRAIERLGRRLGRLELLVDLRFARWTRAGRPLRGRAYGRWRAVLERRRRASRRFDEAVAELVDLGSAARLARHQAAEGDQVAMLEAAAAGRGA